MFSLFTLSSCQKEQVGNSTQFRATMEGCTDQHGKTTLNGTALNWVSGDQIVVYGTAGSSVYTATPQTPATVAVFDNVSGEMGDGPFRAFYPSTMTTDGVNITLSATQTFVDGSINEFPMYVESSDNQLAFKNLCGVLKLHLTKANTNISSITVTANAAVSGTFSINYNNGNPIMNYVTGGSSTLTLVCSTPQSIDNGKDFFIYLPSTIDSIKSITFVADGGTVCTKRTKETVQVGINRSQYTSVSFGEEDLLFLPTGSRGGLFSVGVVNGDTVKVWFSQGNLQYRASDDTWRFAEHQYDYIGSANSHLGSTYNGWIDVYSFGTGNNPIYISANNSDYSATVDWGVNAISNGGNVPNQWRTLSHSEWGYIFSGRPYATLKYGTGSVNGVHGLIVLPDRWITPDGCSFHSGMNGWTNNNYNLLQWDSMEAAGAVFLPAAGRRHNSSGNGVDGINNSGCYWTSSRIDLGGAFAIMFSANSLNRSFGHHSSYGLSVRLVHNSN